MSIINVDLIFTDFSFFGYSILFKKNSAANKEKLLMQTEFVLMIPNINITPSIDELQQHFNNAMNSLFNVHRSVTMWGQQSAKNVISDTDSGKIKHFQIALLNFLFHGTMV